jgi:hypothetical protein
MIVCLAGTSLAWGHEGTREKWVITVMRLNSIACLRKKLPHHLFAAQPRGGLAYNFKLPRGIVLVVVLVLDFRGRGRGRGRKTTRIFISSYPLVSSRRSRAAGCILTSLLQTPQRGFARASSLTKITHLRQRRMTWPGPMATVRPMPRIRASMQPRHLRALSSRQILPG